MSSRTVSALAVAAALAMAAMAVARSTRAGAAAQASPAATSPAAPVFLRWPLPATGKAYSRINGARLWPDVKAHGDIAEHLSPAGSPPILGHHRGHVR